MNLPSPTPFKTPGPDSPGAGISVIAPASFANPERVRRGLETLSTLGFDPTWCAHPERGPLYFAGTPEQRLADLHAAFADAETSIVASVRGGYGSNYLLDGLDLDLIRTTSQTLLRL